MEHGQIKKYSSETVQIGDKLYPTSAKELRLLTYGVKNHDTWRSWIEGLDIPKHAKLYKPWQVKAIVARLDENE